jgi:hypothetical protein
MRRRIGSSRVSDMIEFSADQTIEQVLLAGYYRVPRFQRPYSWTLDNIGEFWSDLTQSLGRDYFIGAVIVYSDSADEPTNRRITDYSIVDGQQRLTTIMVLLAALRDTFAEFEEPDLARGVQGFIARPDRRNIPRFVLEAEGGYPYLQAVVQTFPAEERPPDPMRSDEKLIEQAHRYFRDELRRLRESVLLDTTISREDRPAAFISRLEELRDRVLSLSVILVVVRNVDDAYVIFETLNTRGKDLGLADLVRNFLLRDLREGVGAADMPRNRFNRILEQLQEPGVDLNSADFLHHSWLSRYEYASRKNLFPEIKRRVRSAAAKATYLRDLEVDLPLYTRVRKPDTTTWAREMSAVVRSLRALDVFHMTQPVPLVLAALRAYMVERSLTLRQLKRLLRAVEAFHFKYTAIAGRSSSGGISMRYAAHARRFREDPDHNANIDALVAKLRDALPTREEFVAAFLALGYSSTHTADKALVRYVLDEFYRAAISAVEVDFRAMTIEHLMPESSMQISGAPAAVASIGNLILVSETLNNELASRDFPTKREILGRQRELWVDPTILEADAWTEASIRARAERMAAEAFDHLWVL